MISLARRLALVLVLAVVLGVALAREARAEGEELVSLPARIDRIRVEGLVRTKPFVVRRELGFAEGDVLTQPMFDLAVARLWNTTIFAHVDASVVREGGETVFVVLLEDRWTLNPLFGFGSGGHAFYVRFGAADNNVAGRFLEVQAQYQNFDGFHGGQAIFHDPRLLDERLDLTVQVDRLVRPRPGFSDQRTEGVVELARLALEDRLRFGVRVSSFSSRFLPPLDGAPFYPDESDTFLVEPSLRIGRVDTVRLRQKGASLELRPGLGFTSADPNRYAQTTAELLAFAMLGERWNLALRVHGANVTRVPAHLEVYAGGLDLLRGFPDNYVRTRALSLANVELRLVAFDSTWVALMPVAFVDGALACSPKGPAGGALSVGGGLRVLIPKFVGTGLRVDLAIPLAASLGGVSLAEEARFGPATPAAEVGSVQPSFGVYQFF